MADNDEDLVSQIKITGGDTSAAEIEKLADKGSASFDKLAAAAKRADKAVQGSTTGITDNSRQAATGLTTITNVRVNPQVARSLKDIESGARSLTGSLRPLVQGIGRFTQRIALITSAGAAAATGLAVAARNIAKSVDGTSDSLQRQTDAQIDANNSQLQGRLATINYDSSIRQLGAQLMAGTITYQQYSAQVKQLQTDYREQARVSRQVEAATRAVKEENDRLQKSLKDREAYNQLIATFGGPLTTALLAFGRQIEQTRREMLTAFGPGIGALIDTISGTLSKNATAIGTFFDSASQRLQAFVSANGPAIQTALENIGSAAASVFEGLIAAGPPLLDFFNNQLVPAVKSVVAFFGDVATTINSIFGTKLTGGFLIMLVLLAQLSGALRLFFAVLKTGILSVSLLSKVISALATGGFNPWLIIIGLVATALYLLATRVDWAAWSVTIQNAITSVSTFFSNLRAIVVGVVDAITTRWNTFVAYVQSIPGLIGTVFSTLWTNIQTWAVAAVEAITVRWNAFVAYVGTLPALLGAFFSSIGQTLIDTFNNAVQQVKNFFSDLYNSALSYLQPIIDLLNKINTMSASAESGGGGDTPTFAGGGSIRGPGTSTSDSIPAWLSNNEWVMRAKAVRKYGTSFMRAINEGRFKMPKFSMGGLNMIAPAPRSHFADGGQVSTGNLRPLNLSLFGQEFNGLLMPEDVAGRMTKFAIARQTRSAGRKPAWVGGKS